MKNGQFVISPAIQQWINNQISRKTQNALRKVGIQIVGSAGNPDVVTAYQVISNGRGEVMTHRRLLEIVGK